MSNNPTAYTPPPNVEASPQLPQGRVLSYLGVADTPTRVREVAARGMKWNGWFLLVLSLVFAGLLIWQVVEAVLFSSYPITASDVLESVRDDPPWALLLILLLGPMLMMLLCARSVRRGKKAGCILAMVALVPTLGMTFLTALGFVAAGMTLGLGMTEAHARPICLLWSIPASAAVLYLMLQLDLIRFAVWIARNPVTEKPPIPFIHRNS